MSERIVIEKKLNTEEWFLRQVESYARRQPSGDKTPDCVDDVFLKSYGERPTDVSLSDPRVDHVTSCNYCLGRLLQFRATRPAGASLRFRYAAVAAMGLACLLVGFVVANVWNRKHPTVVQVQSAELHRTLDLSQYGTYRGDQPLSNPAPSSRRAAKAGTCPASPEPARCLLHHGCVRQERTQSRGVRNGDCSGGRSADCGHCVSRSEKCDTG